MDTQFPVVGIGASAGGLEAITQLLENLPADTGMAFVVVQHLDPARESAMADLLGRAGPLPVREVSDRLAVRPDHVYVIPPNCDMVITEGSLRLEPRRPSLGARRSIDYFFESLAQDQGERAIGVVLSGTATDGTLGLEAIKAEGGLTFAQDDTAKYDSMPRSAIAAGCVDFVLPPGEIAKQLARIARHPYPVSDDSEVPPPKSRGRRAGGTARAPSQARSGDRRSAAPEEEARVDDGYRSVLLLLRQHTGIDFMSYKASTVTRRIHRRMVLNQVTTLDDYAKLLRGNDKELDALHADMLISMTAFFRNPEAFEALKTAVLAKFVKRTGDDPIRVWVPGCSTGQEAYSLVMAFLEAAEGIPHPPRLQVFATDVNRRAVDVARTGRYSKSMVEDLSPARMRRFFEEDSGWFRVRKELRERVIFAQHDLLRAPPFSHLDLVSCRNLLIYLRADAQRRLFPLFAYALEPGGFLFLGASETPGTLTDAFEPVDSKARIYALSGTRVGVPPREAVLKPSAASRGAPAAAARAAPDEAHAEVSVVCAADGVALARYAPHGVLIDSEMRVVEYRGDTRPWLKPPTGRATFDLRRVAHECLLAPLRSALREAKKTGRAVRKERVCFKHEADTHMLALDVIPLRHRAEEYYLVCFERTPNPSDPVHAAARGTGRSASQATTAEAPPPLKGGKASPALRRRISDLEREMAEAQDSLQALQQQHDASMEELQSANEEATSANEELQSLNEELEASKEELESANEELNTVNDELANQNSALGRSNSDLQNTERASELEILLLAADATIRRFTPFAAAHFGLQAGDVGRSVRAFEDKMGVENLESIVAEVVANGSERRLELEDTAGRWFSLWVHPYRGTNEGIEGVVLSFLDIDARRRSEDVVKEARAYAEAIVNTVRDAVLILDANLRVHGANDAFHALFRTTHAEVTGQSIYALSQGQWAVRVLRSRLQDILPRHSAFDSLEMSHDIEGLGRRTLLVAGRPLREPGEHATKILLSIRDITEVLQFQVQDRAQGARFRRLFETNTDGLMLVDANTGRIREANAAMAAMLECPPEELRLSELSAVPLSTGTRVLHITLEELEANGPIHCETGVLISRSGVRRTVDIRARLHEDTLGRLIEVNVRERSGPA